MLLRRLVSFQQPASDDDRTQRPYSRERIVRWQLNLDADGQVVDLADLADSSQRSTKFGRPILVPNAGRTSGIAPGLGADDAQYVLGWVDDKVKPERVAEAHRAFVGLTRRWAGEFPDDPAARAMAAFYDRGEMPQPPQGRTWSSRDLMIVAVDDWRVTLRDSLWALWETVVQERKSGSADGGGRHGLCLVCAQPDRPLLDRIPQALPKALIPRADQEVALVSANKRIHTYDFNEGLVGSPICVSCGQAAVANLHTILSDGQFTFTYPRQRTRLAWWVSDGASSDTIRMLDSKPEQIAGYLQALVTGEKRRRPSPELTFCSATLSGNVARLVVHHWVEMPLSQAENNVDTWFRDHQILTRSQNTPTGYPLWLLVLSAGQWLPDTSAVVSGRYIPLADKAADRPDDLAQLLLHSGLYGGTLPPHVLAHIVRRIRTDLHLDGPRAALLRVALTRHPQRTGEGPAAVLDETQNNPAYLHGRLFAVLESLQRRVNGKDDLPNATFFHRYFAGAVANPRVALVQGFQLYPAWLKKLDSMARERGFDRASKDRAQKAAGAATAYRIRIRELQDRLTEPAAPLATAESQSWFILGYFHQQAHDIRMATAGKAPEVPTEGLPADQTPDPIDEGINKQ
ncbi:type I-C CRISPR-associated protein Cas8c/Csd1 [Micromonospora sp. NPDC049460]|uniref:type I-C CRISPR-associated protein Cas8c/Csd1 n=1 Tax=Micromonospora sp. NPDC049460 TaxID=3364272 RepID=UPI0037957548